MDNRYLIVYLMEVLVETTPSFPKEVQCETGSVSNDELGLQVVCEIEQSAVVYGYKMEYAQLRDIFIANGTLKCKCFVLLNIGMSHTLK